MYTLSETANSFMTLYKLNRISIGALRQAVNDGAITEEDYYEITHEEFIKD